MRAALSLTDFLKLPLLVILSLCATLPVGGQTVSESATKVDRIVIVKSTRTMNLMSSGKALKAYKVALSSNSVGRKERLGDNRTPEGLYTVDRKNAHSAYHLALHISYPNAEDRTRAKKLGVNPGGEIEIHGIGAKYGYLGALHRQMDWTQGCIAVTNEEIDEIWKLVSAGTVVEIRP
jgi:murein L,D-transpeptidase YafK